MGRGRPELGLGAGSDKYTEDKCSRLGVGGRLPGLNGLGLRSLEVCEAGAGLPVLG